MKLKVLNIIIIIIFNLMVFADYTNAQPGNIDKIITKAENNIKKRNYDEAIYSLSNLLQDYRDNFKIYYTLSFAYYKKELYTESLSNLKNAFSLAPIQSKKEIIELFYILKKEMKYKEISDSAKFLFDNKKYKEAARLYTKCWLLFPEKENVGLVASDCWIQANYCEHAIKILFLLVVSDDSNISGNAKILLDIASRNYIRDFGIPNTDTNCISICLLTTTDRNKAIEYKKNLDSKSLENFRIDAIEEENSNIYQVLFGCFFSDNEVKFEIDKIKEKYSDYQLSQIDVTGIIPVNWKLKKITLDVNKNKTIEKNKDKKINWDIIK
jgi:tetratricopeptide (TPR) repeat protein